jgi:hypothetical protein
MAKFQLTISADYVPTWGLNEGLREAIQNGLDGGQAGHAFEVAPPTSANPVLRLTNKGITLQRSIWLMGTTSKSSGDYRGCYGEGLKLGALALVRMGRAVTFANGDEDWRVKLEPSPAFDDKPVVTVYTVKRRTPCEDFTVSIACTPQEWQQARTRFLDLLDEKPEAIVDPSQRLTEEPIPLAGMTDAILLDPAFAGHLYVKGILVEVREKMACGYNFSDAKVDRDRAMVNSFDLRWGIARLWDLAIDSAIGPQIEPSKVLDFLERDSEDARSFEMRTPSRNTQRILELEWVKRHGKATVPITSQEEANYASHYGLTPVVSSPAVQRFFRGSDQLDIDQVRATRAVAPARTWRPCELDPGELSNLQLAVAIVDAATASVPSVRSLEDRVDVVDFPDGNVLGMHGGNVVPPRIMLARSILVSFTRTLEVLVHETAHDAGGDGDARHQRAEGALFSQIALDLLLRKNDYSPFLLPFLLNPTPNP